MRIAVVAWALAASMAAGQVTRTAPASDKTLVLNNDGYFRVHYEFGLMRIQPGALKAEGEKLLGAGGMARLRRQTQGHLKDRKIDWKAVDWRDRARVHFRRTQLGDDTRAVEMIPTIPPPGDWAKTGFDDGTWLRQRLGRLPTMRYSMESYDFSSLMIRARRCRTYFLVPDPSKVKALTLDLTYRGGARVLVNGTEVARGHMPKGDLAADAPADPYPRAAYVVLEGEGPQPRGGCFGDIRGDWEHAPSGTRRRREWTKYRLNSMQHGIGEAGWRRLQSLRDRRLTGVKIPAKLLKAGRNVLAIEIRGSDYHPQILPGAGGARRENWGVGGGTDNNTWDHCRLLSVTLRCPSGAVPPAIRRPAGVSAWAEDMHTRVFNRDFNPPGWPEGTLRVVGAQNGSFSAMAVVGTDRALSGLTASASALAGPGGVKIPASGVAVSYLKGRSILQLYQLGHGRCLGLHSWNCPMAAGAVARYGVYLANPPRDGNARRRAEAELLETFKFFDQVSADAPKTVPADTCQPIWLTVKVPAGAAPGKYSGALTVRADGVKPMTLPVAVEVVGWRLPDPLNFQTIVESEQSPYGVHKAYKDRFATRPAAAARTTQPAGKPIPMALWSEKHWELIEASFKQLGRFGADWHFVPVLLNSEFGNRGDSSMIRWVRGADGTLSFDYRVMDRYLDLAIKYCGRPRVVCFGIMHGVGSSTNAVKIFDAVTGKEQIVDVGPGAVATRRPLWRAFATSLRQHMRRRGLEKAMYWGHAFDRVYDPDMVKMMAEFTPGIYWAAGAHARRPDSTFRAVARTYGSDMTDRSMKGWKNPFIHLVMPRSNGSVICVEGTSTPFTYRVLCDRAIYCGFNGIGRMGADYFNVAWFDGFRGGEYLLVGRSCIQTLWPGAGGADSSARNEAMLEGVQEAEARIFMEHAIDRNLLPAALASEAQRALDDHFRRTLYIPGGTAGLTMMEYTGDWQGRSRRLFATAGKVAAAVGMDVAETDIGTEKIDVVFYGQKRAAAARQGVPLPADGTARVAVTIRNWTAKTRRWTAATTQPWIRPAKTRGAVAGAQELPVTLDGADLKPGQTVKGKLTITDAAGGRSYPVEITARIVKPFEMVIGQAVFNVAVGKSASRDYLVVNRTASPQSWQMNAAAPWVTAKPASGKLPAGGSVFVTVAAAPPDKADAIHATAVTLTAMGGAVKQAFDLKTFVYRPYAAPAGRPKGAPVPLASVDKKFFVRHRSIGWFRAKEIYRAPTIGKTLNVWHGHKPAVIGAKTYAVALWAKPAHETVYRLAGSGFTAFSAEVGWNAMVARGGSAGRGHQAVRLFFEIHVDGKVVASSGPVAATDGPRLLVATGLDRAKEIRLVTRTDQDKDPDRDFCYANWGEPTFHKAP